MIRPFLVVALFMVSINGYAGNFKDARPHYHKKHKGEWRIETSERLLTIKPAQLKVKDINSIDFIETYMSSQSMVWTVHLFSALTDNGQTIEFEVVEETGVVSLGRQHLNNLFRMGSQVLGAGIQ